MLDGRRLGRITDIIFSCGGKSEIKGIVVPYCRRFLFWRDREVFVPWQCIKKIGEDVILVDLVVEEGHQHHTHHPKRRRRYDAFEDGRFDGGHGEGHGRGGGAGREGHGEGREGGREERGREQRGHEGDGRGRDSGGRGSGRGGVRTHAVPQSDSDSALPQKEDGEERGEYRKPQFDVSAAAPRKKTPPPPSSDPTLHCDRKCEKCMMFDCAHRWES